MPDNRHLFAHFWSKSRAYEYTGWTKDMLFVGPKGVRWANDEPMLGQCWASLLNVYLQYVDLRYFVGLAHFSLMLAHRSIFSHRWSNFSPTDKLTLGQLLYGKNLWRTNWCFVACVCRHWRVRGSGWLWPELQKHARQLCLLLQIRLHVVVW